LSCGVCHNGKDAFTVRENCKRCHPQYKAIKYDFPKNKDLESVIFSHKVHVEISYRCSDCHYGIYPSSVVRKPVTMQEMNNGKSCGACHGFQMAFSTKKLENCERCHKPGEYE
jgi:c(7)-type cytochrome triheme protein